MKCADEVSPEGGGLPPPGRSLESCIPGVRPGHRIEGRFGRSLYPIEVQSPHGVSHRARALGLEGVAVLGVLVPGMALPLMPCPCG